MKIKNYDFSKLKLKPDAELFIEMFSKGEYSQGDKSYIIEVQPKRPLKIPEAHIEAYRKDARRILDKESKELNAEGIKRLIAALIIETLGNANFGKDN